QIAEVDQRQQNFNAVVSITLEWIDPALAFSPASCNCRFKSYSGENFARFIGDNGLRWPEFTLYNQQNNRWVQNKMAIVYPDGRAMYLERFTTTFQAPDFDFRNYPFDHQNFFIRVDSIFPETFYVFMDMPAFTAIGDELGEEEWIIIDSNVTTSTETGSTLFPSSSYSLNFTARRHLSYYVFRLFVPLGLIVLVSWMTFFLKDYGKRVDVVTGNLLLFIAFNFTVATDLPRLGYLTFIDTILVSVFIISVALVAYNVWLKRLQVQGKEALINRIDPTFNWLYPLIYVAAVAIVILIFFT
ncbi:MAG TPA: hypothetical protein VLS48_01765, partial [Anaerolineales bacterium]|nr:hypothetical protein [Anaerolineales bacterium]